jgi:hypothetical protein
LGLCETDTHQGQKDQQKFHATTTADSFGQVNRFPLDTAVKIHAAY